MVVLGFLAVVADEYQVAARSGQRSSCSTRVIATNF